LDPEKSRRDFDAKKIARELLGDAGIIRNRLKNCRGGLTNAAGVP